MFMIPLEYDVRRISVKKEEPLKRELTDFLDAVENGKEPKVSGADAVKNLRVCEAALDSLRTGTKVMV
jgi:UDP-N-acetylglucosamine 3-dehydrogenase